MSQLELTFLRNPERPFVRSVSFWVEVGPWGAEGPLSVCLSFYASEHTCRFCLAGDTRGRCYLGGVNVGHWSDMRAWYMHVRRGTNEGEHLQSILRGGAEDRGATVALDMFELCLQTQELLFGQS